MKPESQQARESIISELAEQYKFTPEEVEKQEGREIDILLEHGHSHRRIKTIMGNRLALARSVAEWRAEGGRRHERG